MRVKILNKRTAFFNIPLTTVLSLMFYFLCLFSSDTLAEKGNVIVAAGRTDQYLRLLDNKRVAVVANPASLINETHLVDSLFHLRVNVVKVFAPEHGFRGEAEAGEDVKGGIDTKTGIQIVSLYGDHKKPDASDLKGVDIVLFDIQDVGVRFYTYISTLQYIMEACAEYNVPLVLLDRPNPHGHYVDGPVLEDSCKSFVGLQKIPLVYGMTMAEYAMMLNGENWLDNKKKCKLQVVKMLNWDHSTDVHLPVPPSPNLPNDEAIRLYPSLCLFEGTAVSLGRGTAFPFQCYGYPGKSNFEYSFTPISIKGKAVKPLYENVECQGYNLAAWAKVNRPDRIHLEWLIEARSTFPDKEKFFNAFFEKLAGCKALRRQIEENWSEEKIRASWEKDIASFRQIRMKYLLYP